MNRRGKSADTGSMTVMKISKHHIVALVIPGIALLGGLVLAAAEPASITDWGKNLIVARGEARVAVREGTAVRSDTGEETALNKGRLEAHTRAREQAMENLMAQLREIRIDPVSTLRELLLENVDTRMSLEALVSKKARFTDFPVDHFTAGCVLKLKIPDLITALPYTFPGDEFPLILDNTVATAYTSLVIDARGIGIEPMVLPSIYNDEGLEIYGRQFIDPAAARRHGAVTWVHTENEGMTHKRAGAHPYFCVAVRSLNGCPVLSRKDVRKILSSPETIKELKKCRVICIIERSRGER